MQLSEIYSNINTFKVYFVYPETKGVQLEDMDAIFGDRYTREGESTGREALLPRSRHRSPIEDHHLEPPVTDETRNSPADSVGFFARMFTKKNNESGGDYRRLEAGADD